jgi:hypothetical protein
MINNTAAVTAELREAMTRWLEAFPGDLISARQLWYEGLADCGVPGPADVAAIETILHGLEDWRHVGMVRYEKYGPQNSFRRSAVPREKLSDGGRIMVHHMFKLGGLYKAPDGRVLKIVLSEVYNLRCFEVKDGNLVGGMIKIHPESELAKSLVEVTA